MLGLSLADFNIINLSVFAVLAVLSVIAVMVGFFKVLQFMRLGVGRRRQAEQILNRWLDGDVVGALADAKVANSVLTRILRAVFTGLQARPGDHEYAEELGRQIAIGELTVMEKQMRILDVIVQAAPMIGLLGTVVGMIDAFSVLATSEGTANAADLAQGIWTALTTTAAGLSIALIAYFLANWFEGRIDRERMSIELVISGAIHGRLDGISRAL